MGHAERAGDLRRFLTAGKKIIITTVQKFPFILDDIGSDHKDRRFAIVIDEAHSSQGGKASAALNAALTGSEDDEETVEDQINKIIEERRMLPNASYFAFTATPMDGGGSNGCLNRTAAASLSSAQLSTPIWNGKSVWSKTASAPAMGISTPKRRVPN